MSLGSRQLLFGCLATCGLLVLTFRTHLRTHLSSLYFAVILFPPAPPPFCLGPLQPPIMQPHPNDHVPFIVARWIQHKPPCLTSFVDMHLKTNLHNPLSTAFRYFCRADVKDFIFESEVVEIQQALVFEAAQDYFPCMWKHDGLRRNGSSGSSKCGTK